MTKQEYDEKNKELQNQLDELKNVEIEEKGEKWEPQMGERHYYIDSDGEVLLLGFSASEFDLERKKWGIVLRRRKKAQFVADKIKYTQMFKQYIEEHSDPLDWENDKQVKWYAYYNFGRYMLSFNCDFRCKVQGVIYVSSKQVLESAIDFLGEDNVKKYILEAKE